MNNENRTFREVKGLITSAVSAETNASRPWSSKHSKLLSVTLSVAKGYMRT